VSVMRSDLSLLIPDIILEANQRLQGMQAELNRLKTEARKNDIRALEGAIDELQQVIQRHLQ
jgi:hypothetical protein